MYKRNIYKHCPQCLKCLFSAQYGTSLHEQSLRRDQRDTSPWSATHRHSMLVPRVCAPRVTQCRLGKYWWRDFFRKRLRVQVNLDMTDSMGPGKLVRHMQNLSYTYDEYLICIGLGPSISSVICKNPSYSGPSYPSSPVVDSELAIQILISFRCLYLGQIGCQGDGLSRQPIVGVHMLSMTHREAAIFDDACTVPTPCLLLPAVAFINIPHSICNTLYHFWFVWKINMIKTGLSTTKNGEENGDFALSSSIKMA